MNRRTLLEKHAARWRDAMENGHELANHTVSHPAAATSALCVLSGHWSCGHLSVSRRMYCRPRRHCGVCFWNHGAQLRLSVRANVCRREVPLLAPVIARHLGRPVWANPPTILAFVISIASALDGRRNWRANDLCCSPIEAGHWAIFCFHGIGAIITVDNEPFEELVRYLAEQPRTDGYGTEVGLAVGRIQKETA